MRETERRAVVMVIQRGDPEIGAALMRGVIAGRAEAGDAFSHGCAATASSTPSVSLRLTAPSTPSVSLRLTAPSGREPGREPGRELFEGRTMESLEIVTVEQDKWRRVARQVRIAVGNDRTAEDYRQLIVKARGDYAIHASRGRMHDFAGKLLLAWAMLCEAMRKAYRAQDRVLKP